MKKPLLFGIILTACIVIVTFVFAQFYPEGMISYWKFDDATAFDSADANDGIIYGPTAITGQVGKALSFDGVNDYVRVEDDDSLSSSGGVTVEAWIKANSFGAINMVVGKWNNGFREYEIQLWNGKVRFYAWNGSEYIHAESVTKLSLSTWYHIAGVFDDINDELRVYINGAQDGAPTAFSLPIPNSNSYLTIGAQFWTSGWWRFFDGVIDEVAIYDRALSVDGINQHYENGLNGLGYEVAECVPHPSDMVSWWDGDAVSGTTVLDIKGGNNGTMVSDVSLVPGMVGNAFTFTGTDYVRVPNNISLEPPNVTVDAWVKSSSPGSTRYIVAKGGTSSCLAASYALYTRGGGLCFYVYNGSAYVLSPNAGTGIWDGRWHHVAGTFDGSFVRLYVDGAEVGSGTFTTIIIGYGLSTNNDLLIGRFGGICTLPFTGDIDEVEIFSRALLQSEIQAIFLARSAGKCKTTNQPPVANCQDIVIDADANCQAFITPENVDDGSYDPDGEDDIAEIWVDNLGPFSPGVHYVNLTITDESNESDTCQAKVTVIDTTPPEISVSVSPNILRPPNHKMVLINPTITVSDNCDLSSELEVVLISITMDEGDDTDTYHQDYDSTLGDGHTTNDIQVDENGKIYLRAERSGKGDGRVYEITYEVTDASGNSTTATAQVTVPHDRR